ncbi:MAG TPA: Smr/MutS family protein [Terriglobales bacterium]|nr:Smr/MutS family protein [Terriglobales bacterium]
MSRKPQQIKTINLEAGMPRAEEARLRLEYELQLARREGYVAVKLIHGYGSSGVGGVLRTEIQKVLANAIQTGKIQGFIAGEDWRTSNELAWNVVSKYPEWKQDRDFGRQNKGITIALL